MGGSIDKDIRAVRVGPDWRLAIVVTPGCFQGEPIPSVPQVLPVVKDRCAAITGHYLN